MANYTRKAVMSSIIVFSMNILASLFSYLFKIYLARELTVAEFGLIFSLFSLFGLITYLKTFGVDTATSKFISELKVSNNYAQIKRYLVVGLGFSFLTSLIVGFIIFILSDVIALYYFKDVSSSIFIKYMTVAFLFSSVVTIVASGFLGLQKHMYNKLIQSLRELLILVITFVGIAFGLTLYAPLLGKILSTLIIAVIFLVLLFVILHKMQKEDTGRDMLNPDYSNQQFTISQSLKNQLKFGVPVAISSIATKIFTQVDVVILTMLTSLEQVGLYNVALPTVRILWSISISVAVILMPLTSELVTRKKFDVLSSGITVLYKYLYVIILPPTLVVFYYSREIISFLFGVEYQAASLALKLLTGGVLFVAIAKLNIAFLTGFNEPKYVAKIMMSGALLNLIGNVVLIYFFGMVGAAIATSLSFIVIAILSVKKLRSLCPFSLPLRHFVLVSVSGIGFFLLMYVLDSLIPSQFLVRSSISGICAGVIYLSFLFLFKVVTLTELKENLSRVFKKKKSETE